MADKWELLDSKLGGISLNGPFSYWRKEPVSIRDQDAFAAKNMPDLGYAVKDFNVFSWRLNDWKKTKNRLTSRAFECGGHHWQIIFSPHGDHPSKDNVSIHLKYADPKRSPEDWHVCVQYALVISNPNDPATYTASHGHSRFTSEKYIWGFPRFCELRKLFLAQDSHSRPTIEDDVADVSAFVRVLYDPTGVLWLENPVSVRDHDAFATKCMPELGHEVKDFTVFTWRLRSWHKSKNDLVSPKFKCGGHQWKVIYSCGNTRESSNDTISVYLNLVVPELIPAGWHACAQFTLAISNPKHPTIYTFDHDCHRFDIKEPDRGFPHFSNLRKLYQTQDRHSRPTIEDGVAIVSVFLRVFDESASALWLNFANYDSTTIETTVEPLHSTLGKLKHLNLTGEIIYDNTIMKAFGGYADVFLGEYTGHSSKVAVKRLRIHAQGDHDFAKQLAKEMNVWSKLVHPNILPLWGYVLEGDLPCLISEWMDNGTALRYLSAHPDCIIENMVIGIARGVCYLHSLDIIHSDLKADNVLVSRDGEPLVCDFGISRRLSSTHTMLGRTTTGAMKGSIRWISPEILNVESSESTPSHTKESDIWAFGMLVYELLTRKLPFHHLKLDVHVILAIMKGQIPSFEPSHFSTPRLRSFVSICCDELTCWNKDPGQRPSMQTVLSDLERFLVPTL